MSFYKTLGVLGTFAMTFGAPLAMAAEEVLGGGDYNPYKSLASALAIGLAVLAGAMSQSRTAIAALEAIGRNPAAQGKIFVPMIIALALIESLVLYAFVIALVKIPS